MGGCVGKKIQLFLFQGYQQYQQGNIAMLQQVLPDRFNGERQVLLKGITGNIHKSSRLFIASTLLPAEDKRFPALWRQAIDRLVQQLFILFGFHGIHERLVVDAQGSAMHYLVADRIKQSNAVQLCKGGITGQAVQVGSKRRLDIQLRPDFPYLQENIMHQVLRKRRIPGKLQQVIINTAMVLLVDSSKRIAVAERQLLQ